MSRSLTNSSFSNPSFLCIRQFRLFSRSLTSTCTFQTTSRPSSSQSGLLGQRTFSQLQSAKARIPAPYRPFPSFNPGNKLKLIQPRHCSSMAPAVASDRDVLPDNIKPINYDISLFDLELSGAFTYQGTVTILAKIQKQSTEITLNTHELKIHGVEVSLEHTKTQQSFKSTGVTYDGPRQRATITFAEEIPVSEKATITIKFEGVINQSMAGFSMASCKCYKSFRLSQAFMLVS